MARIPAFVEKIEYSEKRKDEIIFDDSINALFYEMNSAERVTKVKEMIEKMNVFWNYSFHNQFLIMVQAPDSTRVASFKTWLKLRRFVKKGEKGIAIWVPVPYKSKAKKRHIDLGIAKQDPKTKEWFLPKLSFKTGYVFDVSQTDGEPLEMHGPVALGDTTRAIGALNGCASKNKIEVEYVDLMKPHGCWGRSMGGKIQLDKFMNREQQCAVFAHEVAHELLHQAKEDFDEKNLERHRLSCRAKEFEAEMVAYVFCKHSGLNIESSSTYILMWADADPKLAKTELFKSMDRIKKTTRTMLGVG